MDVADDAALIDDDEKGHTPQFEQIHFLLIAAGNPVVRIGHARKRKAVLGPILLERLLRVRAHGKDLRVAPRKLGVVVPEARQLRAAERSEESAQKSQYDRPAAVVGKSDRSAQDILQLEIRGFLSGSKETRHRPQAFVTQPRSGQTLRP
jgi:hypothetical protein